MSVQFTDIGIKFFIGCIGALYAVYTHLTSQLPGIKESIELQKTEDKIDELEMKSTQILESVQEARTKLENNKIKNDVFNDLSDSWNAELVVLEQKRKDMMEIYEAKRNSLKTQAAVLFFIIGGSIAALFTQGTMLTEGGLNYQTMIAALAIGFAGPGYISKLTELKTEEQVTNYRKELIENMKDSFEGTITKLVDENETLKKANQEIINESNKLKTAADKYADIVNTAKEIIENQGEFIDTVKTTIKNIDNEELLEELKTIKIFEEMIQ